MEYITMICDIKNSKRLEHRESVQYQIIDMLKEANLRFSEMIACPFIITLGDEWQGLLHYPCDYSQILTFFRGKLGEVDFYCAIGIGDITIHNFELTVNQLDGPSFHKARQAIQIIKQLDYSFICIH